MVGDAVGEMVGPVKATDGVRKKERERMQEEGVRVEEERGDGEMKEEEEKETIQWPSHHSCYEVVTAWVHPRYSNITS